MSEWFDPKSTSGLNVKALIDQVPQGTFRRFTLKELPPGYFSSGLLAKVQEVIAVHSGPLLMLNFYRLDGKMIDQQPYGVVVVSGVASASGGYIQHGNWIDRWTPQLASGVAASGIGSGQFFNGLPAARTGSVSELGPSNCAAFEKLAGYVSGLLPPQTSD